MASADQIKALLKAYSSGNEAQFLSVAMQIAAKEARAGHGKLAEELKTLIDESKARVPTTELSPIPMARPRGEVAELLTVTYPKVRFRDMVLSARLRQTLERVLREHKNIRRLRSHGLAPRKKLLLLGPPGTGKTLTASALAGELGLPLFEVRLDRLITKYMGETAGKLRLVFDAIAQTRAVYLFDEFDSIGSERGLENDVGEIRRVVNSFLQMVEQDASDSLIIAASNHGTILDKALFRRFDDVIRYTLPTRAEAAAALKANLTGFKSTRIPWTDLAKSATGLSYGDLLRASEDAMKHALIEHRAVTRADIATAVAERQLVGNPSSPKRSRK